MFFANTGAALLAITVRHIHEAYVASAANDPKCWGFVMLTEDAAALRKWRSDRSMTLGVAAQALYRH